LSLNPIFLFTATAPTDTYALSLHDALPISRQRRVERGGLAGAGGPGDEEDAMGLLDQHIDLVAHRAAHAEAVQREAPALLVEQRSEEHTSELQSRFDLVCRLLLEKKKK